MSNSQPTKIIMNKIEKKNSTNKRIKKKKKELKITRTEFDTKKWNQIVREDIEKQFSIKKMIRKK